MSQEKTMATTHPEVRALPLVTLVLSQTPIQVERRAQFDQQALQELAATIKATGRVEQAITVRSMRARFEDEAIRFEVADGERRVLATEMAGLEEILAEVRELTDEQVEEIQIVTGLQKEKLHELVEAEGYETLCKRGLSVEEIAAKCGKSTATVYARMKLLALCGDGRAAVRTGKISASVGLLIARMPLEKLQKEALQEIIGGSSYTGDPMTYREVSNLLQRRYMLRLDQAPFDVADATLVKKAGACGACPKNSASQPELFADVSSGAMCTDQVCFARKKSAHVNRELAEAKASGQQVIRGKDADRIAPHGGTYNMKEGWISLHETPIGALKPDAKVALLQLPGDPDRVVKIVQRKDVKQNPKSSPATSSRASSPPPNPKEAFTAKYHAKVFSEISAKVNRVERWLLEDIAIEQLSIGDVPHEIVRTIGVDPSAAQVKVEKQVRALSDAGLQKLLIALLIGWEFGNAHRQPEKLLAIAKRYKVNVEKVRKDLEAAEKAAAAPAKQILGANDAKDYAARLKTPKKKAAKK